MKEFAFNELLESVQQAVKISKGEMAPSRVFHVEPVDVKEIREKTHTQYVERILRPSAVTM